MMRARCKRCKDELYSDNGRFVACTCYHTKNDAFYQIQREQKQIEGESDQEFDIRKLRIYKALDMPEGIAIDSTRHYTRIIGDADMLEVIETDNEDEGFFNRD